MPRAIVFPEVSLASGRYKIDFSIDDPNSPNLIANRYDRDFVPIPDGDVLHWFPYTVGSAVFMENNWMRVNGDAMLSGAWFNNTTIGKRYQLVILLDVVQGQPAAPVNIYVGTQLILSTTTKGTTVTIEFTADGTYDSIYMSSTSNFYMRLISLIEIETGIITRLGDVKIGNDNKKDWLLYPGVVEFDFKVHPDYISSYLKDYQKWQQVDKLLKSCECYINLYHWEETAWVKWLRTKLDSGDIGSDSKEKVFKVRTLDALTSLKSNRYINPNPAEYAYGYLRLSTAIQFMFDKSASYPNGCEFIGDWKFRDINDTADYFLDDVYLNDISFEYPDINSIGLNSDIPFTTYGDCLKGFMHNLTSVFIAGFNDRNIIMPIEYNGKPEDIHVLYMNEMPPLEMFNVEKETGLNVTIHNDKGDWNYGRDYIVSTKNRFMLQGQQWVGDNDLNLHEEFIEFDFAATLSGSGKVGNMIAGHTYTIAFMVLQLPSGVGMDVVINGTEVLANSTIVGVRQYVTFVASSNGNTVQFRTNDTNYAWLSEVTLQEGDLGLIYPVRESNSDYADVWFPFPTDYASSSYNNPNLVLDVNGTNPVKLGAVRYRQRDGNYSELDSLANHATSIIGRQLLNGRNGFIAKPKGVDIPQDKFFEIRYSRTNQVNVFGKVFRAKQFLVSPEKNRTNLWLVEC